VLAVKRRPRMKDSKLREPGACNPGDPLPGHAILLTAPPWRTPPEIRGVLVEHTKRPRIREHCVVREVAQPA
jgi:hypothetical protein